MTSQRTFLSFSFLLLLLLATMLLLALSTLSNTNTAIVYQQQVTTGEWLDGQHANVQSGLRIRPHAAKHGAEANDIYVRLLVGHCAASTTWCGASDLEKMHICALSNGLVGAILQFGDEITTGFWGKGEYWERRAIRDKWQVCE